MKKKVLIVFALIFFAVALQWVLSHVSFFEHLELMSYDIRSKFATDNGIFGNKNKVNHSDKDIVILAIDDYSRQELRKHPRLDLGPWPWKRDSWNEVLDFVEQGKPKAVLFDMVFDGLDANEWNDRRFAQDLKRYDNTVLGTYLDNPKVGDDRFADQIDIDENDYIPIKKSLDVQIDDKKLEDAITYTTNSPVHNIYTQDNIMGVINKVLDTDSVVRKNQPIYKLVKNGETYYMPSLAFAGFLKYMGDDGKIVIKNHEIHYKGRVIPIDENGVVNISWHKMGRSYSYIPISKIFLNNGQEDEIRPEYFKDKLVIIGKTESGKGINLKAIVDSKYAGPESTAVALDNFMNDSIPSVGRKRFISEIPKPVQALITIIACIIVAVLCLVSKSAFIGCLNGFFSIIIYIIVCFWLFTNPNSRVWVPIVVPLYYLTMVTGVIFAYRFYKEVTKKASIMSVFGKFVSPKVLSTVLKNPEKMVLKNTRKHLTVLFCDVKDFTSLSEKCNPEQLVADLNELFDCIVNVIFDNDGTVDKFIGDCIMAYWGDFTTSEDDAYLAVKTALEIKKKVNELKIKNAKEGKIILDVKIGINTGEALLGLAGAEKIMNYTAMGDAVNIASRLESNCSNLKRDILISDSTYQEAKDKIVVLDVGKISVKGRNEQIEVYEPIGLADDDAEVK